MYRRASSTLEQDRKAPPVNEQEEKGPLYQLRAEETQALDSVAALLGCRGTARRLGD